MNKDTYDRPSLSIPIIIFLVLVISFSAIAFFYYRFQKERVLHEKQNELSAIADLKIWQITQWRNERLGDAEIISENILAAQEIESYFRAPNESNQKNEILSWLHSFHNNIKYQSAYIFDTAGNVRLSDFPYSDSLKSNVRTLVKQALVQKKAILSDFQRSDDPSKMPLFLVVPLMSAERNGISLVGVLVLSIDPNKLLFPLIQLWPTPSRSSETLLIEQDNTDVVFLNELRHQKNTASIIKFPISTEQLPAAMAVRGFEGIAEGIDYRGIPVLAAIRQISNSPWFLVSKVDRDEVDAPLRFQAWTIIGMVILLILASGAFLGLWWRNQRVLFYKRQVQIKVDRLALIKHFEYLLLYANDILILANESFKIIEVNNRASDTYGYTHDEMLALNISDLHFIRLGEFPEQIKYDIEHDGATFEAIHKRKDGSTFPVELSVRRIEIEGNKYYQMIIRDITERKEAEEILKESEEKFRTFAEQSPNMIFINYNGRVVYANAQCEEQMGYSKEEFYSPDFSFLKITAPESVELLQEAFSKHRRGEEVPAYEYTVLTKQRSRINVIITTKLISYETGKAILGIITDITERKKIEESLLKFQLGIERSSDAVFITDPSGSIIYVNPSFEQLYGFSFQEVSEKTPRILKSGLTPPENYADFWRTLLSKNVVSGEIVNKTKDGRFIHVEGSNNPILDEQGNIIGFLGIHRDITARKNEEEELQRSFSLIQATLESTADGILVVDNTGIITNYNAQFIKMWNIPENIMTEGKDREVINFVLAQLKSPKNFVSKVNDLYAHPEKESFDVLEFKNGRIFERYSHPQRIDGKPVGRVWSFRDVTQRKIAEEQLQESEERYRNLVEYSPDAIAVHQEGKFVYVNPAAMKLLGATTESQLIGISVIDIIHPDDVEIVRQRVLVGMKERKALPPMEEKLIRLDGLVVEVEVTSLPIIFQGKPATQVVTRDITQQKRLQNQVFQSQKIQSIGTLAGGIAHDFNNILAIILGYSSTLERNRNDEQKHLEGITAINQAISRGAALVRQILTFARKTDIAFAPVNIPNLLHELLSMLKETFSKTITFTQTYSPDLPDIIADRTQIHQTLLNLCVNARDAMPNGGSITIKAEPWMKKDVSKRFPSAAEETYVCISVADTGIGMDKAIHNRVFDPFFTTKEKGKGTGLGLSVVYGVMQSHHGFVDVESSVGKGTTFFLFFPVSPLAEKQADEIPMETEQPSGGTETILFIEDEYLILKAIRHLLKSYGYNVYVAADGEEGIDVFTRHQDEIALVLSDVGLPKVSGFDVFKKLKEIDPTVKIILASGFFEPDLKSSLQQLGAKGFIQKPYSNDEVLRKIREILDEKSTLNDNQESRKKG
jgi:two-component system, cell cycle sensor histidine kinase and response regulator CckA